MENKYETVLPMTKPNAKNTVILAMFCAAAYVLMYVSKLIPVNIAGFLSMDFKDIAIVICGFTLGPVSVFAVTTVVSLMEMLTVSINGPVGFLMNVLSTCAFAYTASMIYIISKSHKSAVLGLLTGTVCMTLTMLLWNRIVTPAYMGVEKEVVESMLIPVFLPFNLVKGGLNAFGVILVYKPVLRALDKG